MREILELDEREKRDNIMRNHTKGGFATLACTGTGLRPRRRRMLIFTRVQEKHHTSRIKKIKGR